MGYILVSEINSNSIKMKPGFGIFPPSKLVAAISFLTGHKHGCSTREGYGRGFRVPLGGTHGRMELR